MGASIGLFAGARGMLVLNDPSRVPKRFNFTTLGMGVGARVPKSIQLPGIPLPMRQSLSGSGSTTDFWASGIVFMHPSFKGGELKTSDFCGGAFTADFSFGLLIAKGCTATHVGVPMPMMLAAPFNPAFATLAANSAKAVILMKGVSEGLIDGHSLSSSMGTISFDGDYTEQEKPRHKRRGHALPAITRESRFHVRARLRLRFLSQIDAPPTRTSGPNARPSNLAGMLVDAMPCAFSTATTSRKSVFETA